MNEPFVVAQPFRAAPAAVGRPEGLRYHRPLAVLKCMLIVTFALSAAPAAAQQAFTGRLSDSACGAAHQKKDHTDRECLVACINALAKYVLVDADGRAIPIVNQDAMGLPLYAGRPVKITGEMKGGALVVAKVEAIPAHLHIGHVMTNWRDTPGTRGFLPVAIDEARVAALHAKLAAKSASLDEIELHAAHALHALDPGREAKGPGAAYGVKKATAGALQHLDFAAHAEGATPAITTHAAAAAASLSEAMRLVDEAIGAAEQARSAPDSAAAAAAASRLAALTDDLAGKALQDAQSHLSVILKAEGLQGAPRH